MKQRTVLGILIGLAISVAIGIGAATRIPTFPAYDTVTDVGKIPVIASNGNFTYATAVTGPAASTNHDLIAFSGTGGHTLIDTNTPYENVVLVSRAVQAGAGLAVTNSGLLSADITLSVADAGVTLAKMANLAQDQFIGRTTASTGVPQTATITSAARTVLDDTTVSAMVDTLGGVAAQGSGAIVRATSPTITTPTVGGLLTAASGQISFPASANLSAGANTLDDYEEGTWTPAFSFTSGSVTYFSQIGAYTKIGRSVTLSWILIVNTASSPLGTVKITGIPFQIGSTTNYEGATRPLGLTGVTGQIFAYGPNGATGLTLEIQNNGAVSNLQGSSIPSSSSLGGSITYFE